MKTEYEFLLGFWGEAMNVNLIEREFGIKGPYSWFATRKERDEFKQKLKDFAKRHAVGIVFSEYEGKDVRRRTIAKMAFEYDGRVFPLDYDFGYGYPPASAEYMFTEGNYGCDCNRSILLHDEYPDFPEVDDCGEKIKMTKFEVVLS